MNELDISQPLLISSPFISILLGGFFGVWAWRRPLIAAGVILGAGRLLSCIELFADRLPIHFFFVYVLALGIGCNLISSAINSPARFKVLKSLPVSAYFAYWVTMVSIYYSMGQLEGGGGASRIRHFFINDFLPIGTILFTLQDRKNTIKVLNSAFISFLFVQSLMFMLAISNIAAGVGVYMLRYVSLLGLPLFASSNMLFFVLALSVNLVEGKQSLNWLGVFALLVAVPLLIVSQSRFPIVGAALLTPYILIKNNFRVKRLIQLSVVPLVGAFLLAFTNFEQFESVAREIFSSRFSEKAAMSDDGLLSGRSALWRQAFDSFLESPIVGKGMGNATEAIFAQNDISGATDGTLYRPGAHNFLLETLGENGLLGMVFICVFAAAAVRVMLKLRPTEYIPNSYIVALKAVFVYSFIICFVGGPDYFFVAGFMGIVIRMQSAAVT